uniref:Uncharacterized protein n=1 Tax=Pundamilia nyererei TaxID=303518 RepID=A0A3B4FXU0_9CICH
KPCDKMKRGYRPLCECRSRSAAMAGVFDIDLDQPEENVSDDENEEVYFSGRR